MAYTWQAVDPSLCSNIVITNQHSIWELVYLETGHKPKIYI